MYRRGGALRLAGAGKSAKDRMAVNAAMKVMSGRKPAAFASRSGRIKNFIKKANTFLNKHKVLSRLGARYGATGMPYAAQVGKAAPYAAKLGYGRRRMRY